MIVNGQEVKIDLASQTLDTLETIKERLAAALNSLPRYLTIRRGDPFQDDDLELIDVLQAIRQHAESGNLDFPRWYQEYEELILSNPVLQLEQDVFVIWLALNTSLQPGPNRDVSIMALIDVINNNPELSDRLATTLASLKGVAADQYLDRLPAKKRALQKMVTANQGRSARTTAVLAEYDQIAEGIPITAGDLERASFNLVIDAGGLSLLELFNSLRLNSDAPFATVANFFKVANNFVPDRVWSQISFDDLLILRISERLETTGLTMTDYNEANLSLNNDLLEARLNLRAGGQNLDRQPFIERFQRLFRGIEMKVVDQVDEQIITVFRSPQQTLNKHVLADLVMTDPVARMVLSINEGQKSTKAKTNIYVYFDHPIYGSATVNITERMATKADERRWGSDFPTGSSYLRWKAKSANGESMDRFIRIMTRLMTRYNSRYDEIVAFYRDYIPDFGERVVAPNQAPTAVALKDQVPELFEPAGYVRACAEKPRIVSDDEAAMLQRDGTQVMRFPIRGESEPRNYVCAPGFFPGLKKNTNPGNNDRFPYYPCCYKKDQTEQPRSSYRQYFDGEEVKQRAVKQGEIIITNKLVQTGQRGTLPSDITTILNLVNTQPDSQFLRVGVGLGPSSLLQCVIESLDLQGINALDPNSRQLFAHEQRRNKEFYNLAILARQCGYELSRQELRRLIQGNGYLDPKIFIPVLEEYFDCYIYLFTRQRGNGQLTIPYHSAGYYRRHRSNVPVVLIYEHRGGEFDNRPYPQCEKIVLLQGRQTQESFPSSSPMGQALERVYQLRLSSFTLRSPPSDVLFPYPAGVKIWSQYIDLHGKCRWLNIGSRNHKITLLTEPMLPIPDATMEARNRRIHTATLVAARTLFRDWKIQLLAQTIVDEQVRELIGRLGTIEVSVLIKSTSRAPPIPGLPESGREVSYPDQLTSQLKRYNYQKKIARYLIEYSKWLCSRFLQGQEATNELIEQFCAEMILDPDHPYGENIQKKFQLDSPLLRDGQLVITSKEMRKRVCYSLKLYNRRHHHDMSTYHQRQYLQDFYVDITDFYRFPGQIILEGDDSVDKLIDERRGADELLDRVDPGRRRPYFFQNSLIENGQLFLAQNVGTLEQALALSQTWYDQGYNSGDREERALLEIPEHRLFAYVNSTTIATLPQPGQPTIHSHRIIAYDDPRIFTVLLDI